MLNNITVIVKWVKGDDENIYVEKQSLLRALENAKQMYEEPKAISTMQSLIDFITDIGA